MDTESSHSITSGNEMIISFPTSVVSSLATLKASFLQRCVHIITAICIYKDWYVCPRFEGWLAAREEGLGRSGLAEFLFNLFHLDVVRLLCADSPPSAQDWLNLVTFDDGSYYAVYAVIVKLTDPATGIVKFELYHGSATGQKDGFKRRKRAYINLNKLQLPQFLRDHIDRGDQIEIVAVIPLLRASPEDELQDNIEDIRIAVLFAESLLMIWNRTLKKGGEYEKIMDHSPWKSNDLTVVRRNVGLSLREYPSNIRYTKEQMAALKERNNADWRAKYVSRKLKEEAEMTPDELSAAALRLWEREDKSALMASTRSVIDGVRRDAREQAAMTPAELSAAVLRLWEREDNLAPIGSTTREAESVRRDVKKQAAMTPLSCQQRCCGSGKGRIETLQRNKKGGRPKGGRSRTKGGRRNFIQSICLNQLRRRQHEDKANK